MNKFIKAFNLLILISALDLVDVCTGTSEILLKVGCSISAHKNKNVEKLGDIFLTSATNFSRRWHDNEPKSIFKMEVFGCMYTKGKSVEQLVQMGLEYYWKRKYKDAIFVFDIVIDKDPSVGKYFEHRGYIFLEMEEFGKAASDFRKAVTLAKNSGKTDTLHSSTLVKLGKELLKLKNYYLYDDMIWCIDEAINKNPSKWSYYKLKGDFHLVKNEYSEALDAYQKAESVAIKNNEKFVLDESSQMTLKIFGSQLQRSKDYEGAIWCFTKIIEQNPSDIMSYKYRADCYLALDKMEKAVADLGEIEYREPQVITAKADLVKALFEKGKVNEAENEAKTLNTRQLGILGSEFLLSKDYKMGHRFLSAAIAKDRKNDEFYQKRGTCREKLGNFEEAITDFETAIQLAVTDKHLWSLYSRDLLRASMLANRVNEAVKIVLALEEKGDLNGTDLCILCQAEEELGMKKEREKHPSCRSCKQQDLYHRYIEV